VHIEFFQAWSAWSLLSAAAARCQCQRKRC